MTCRSKTNLEANCRANPMAGSAYCFVHNPATKQQHRAAVKKGGLTSPYKSQNILPVIDMTTVEDITDILSDTINRVRKVQQDGSMDTQTANAVGHLCGKYIEAHKVLTLEKRLNLLEESVSKLPTAGARQ